MKNRLRLNHLDGFLKGFLDLVFTDLLLLNILHLFVFSFLKTWLFNLNLLRVFNHLVILIGSRLNRGFFCKKSSFGGLRLYNVLLNSLSLFSL